MTDDLTPMLGAGIYLPSNAARWVQEGQRGLSSMALFALTMGLDLRGEPWTRHGFQYPYDPDDFQRCERMLRMVPEARARLDRARVSREWRALLDHWSELVALLESEIPGIFEGEPKYGMARQTYGRMQALLGEASA